MVAVDSDGRPVEIPALHPKNPAEVKRFDAARSCHEANLPGAGRPRDQARQATKRRVGDVAGTATVVAVVVSSRFETSPRRLGHEKCPVHGGYHL